MGDGLKRRVRILWDDDENVFFILIIVVVSWVHTSVKTHKIVPSNCVIKLSHLLYVNYNPIKLNFNFRLNASISREWMVRGKNSKDIH